MVIRDRRANRHQVRRPLCPESDRQPFHGHMSLWANRRRLNMLAAHVPLPLLFAVAFLSPTPSFGQLSVITSVGFAAAYSAMLYAFDLTRWPGSSRSSVPRPQSCPGKASAGYRGGNPGQRAHRRGRLDGVRPCLPAWCRGHLVEAGRRHLPVRSVRGLDQGPESRQHRGTAGA